jgi:hypothetical protein
LIFIEIITCFTAGHYRHGVRFIENRHEIDEKVVESSHKGDNFKVENGGIYKIFEDDHLQLALYTIYIVIRMAGHTKFEDDQLQLASW